MSSVPVTRKNATATPIHVADGWARGPDGERLHPFARFAERIMQGGEVTDADVAAQAGVGAFYVTDAQGNLVRVDCPE